MCSEPYLGCGASEKQRSSAAVRGIRWSCCLLSKSSYPLAHCWKVFKGKSLMISHNWVCAGPVLIWSARRVPDHAFTVHCQCPFICRQLHDFYVCALGCWAVDGIFVKDYTCVQTQISTSHGAETLCPNAFCLITTEIANFCLPPGSFEGTEVLLPSEHNYKC